MKSLFRFPKSIKTLSNKPKTFYHLLSLFLCQVCFNILGDNKYDVVLERSNKNFGKKPITQVWPKNRYVLINPPLKEKLFIYFLYILLTKKNLIFTFLQLYAVPELFLLISLTGKICYSFSYWIAMLYRKRFFKNQLAIMHIPVIKIGHVKF